MSERETPQIFHEVGAAKNPSENTNPSTERDDRGKLVKEPSFESREYAVGNDRWHLDELIGRH